MIIKSLLDNDLYKFTMQQIVLHKFSNVQVEYKFVNRSASPLAEYADHIRQEVDQLENLTLTPSEKEYILNMGFFKPDYVEFLSNLQLNPRKYVKIWVDEQNRLQIRIKGSWLHTILFEVPVLAIVSEIAGEENQQNQHIRHADIFQSAERRLAEKLKTIKSTPGFRFADFGTRRRFSYELHKFVIEYLKNNFGESFVGTSNVRLAMMNGIKAIGTMAHEYLMAHQQIYNLKGHQQKALNNWADEYQGKLGIVLTDTLTTDVFIRDFHLGHAKLFDGIRQDSGDPYEVCEKFIRHYKNLGIDPRTKTIIFSDSLSFPKAAEIYNHFKNQIGISFGIGTNLTNDIAKLEAANIVIKMAKVFDLPVAKLSDSPGKELCENEHYLNYLKEAIHYQNPDH